MHCVVCLKAHYTHEHSGNDISYTVELGYLPYLVLVYQYGIDPYV